MNNIACNLIYNNGGEDVLVGFQKKCDIQNIIYNSKEGGKNWCSQNDCSCSKFRNNGFNGQLDDFPCNESRLFEKWIWTPGNSFETNRPFLIKNSGSGKIAILTTKFKNSKEEDRSIVGFFLIDKIIDSHLVIANKEKSLRLTLDEAKELKFWNYYSNRNSAKPEWKQGRFRYIDDNQIVNILQDIHIVAQNSTTKSLLKDILKENFDYELPEFTSENNIKNILLQRKYGKGGESLEHKLLKEFVSKNPSKIGITEIDVNVNVEHKFISNDLVDILFYQNDKRSYVIEIELNNVLPGIHQAIKYRALRCSQLNLNLDDSNVKAIIVAWSFTESEIKLCQQYNIDYYSIKL
jgi:hypothetical protein